MAEVGADAAIWQDEPRLTTLDDLPPLLEALLLVAPEPTPLQDLARVAGVTITDLEIALAAMEAEVSRGWVVVRHNDTVQLATAPRFGQAVRRFLGLDRESRLSGAALETVALIAYLQPITRAEIESLRGVDSSGVLATLHARGLIEVAGRLPSVGNPNQYVTSAEFLRQFGLTSLADLPPIEHLSPVAGDLLLEETTSLVDRPEGGDAAAP